MIYLHSLLTRAWVEGGVFFSFMGRLPQITPRINNSTFGSDMAVLWRRIDPNTQAKKTTAELVGTLRVPCLKAL